MTKEVYPKVRKNPPLLCGIRYKVTGGSAMARLSGCSLGLQIKDLEQCRRCPKYWPGNFKRAGEAITAAAAATKKASEEDSNNMKIKLDPGAHMPTRAHNTDAGLDLYAIEGQIIPAGGSAIFDTGVHVALPMCTAGFLKSKSGLNTKHGITSEGVIDVGYTGSIVAKLYNNGPADYEVKAGDKITQLVVLPIVSPTLDLVDDLEETERGAGGFGSSGR